MGNSFAPPVFIDPRWYAATPDEQVAIREEQDRLYRPDPLPFDGVSLSRERIDRVRKTALLLGGWNPVSSLSLCDEIVRLHDVLSAISLSLHLGLYREALALSLSESDPSWGRPIDEAPLSDE